MLDEARIRQALDNRLSGLEASGARRTRIRAAIQDEKREDLPVKRKLSGMLAVIIALMMMTSVALAAGLGLFGQLTETTEDARMPYLDAASTYINQEFPLEGGVTLTLQQAYYDGTRVFVSYTLTGGRTHTETGVGSPEVTQWSSVEENTIMAQTYGSENSAMQQVIQYLDGSEPRWGRVVSTGTLDGMQLADGTYLEIIGGDAFEQPDGTWLGWKECTVPAEAAAKELTVQIGTYRTETLYYQDAKDLYVCKKVSMKDTQQYHSFKVTLDEQRVPVTGSIAGEDWSATAALQLSRVDIRGEVTVKAPKSWRDYWLDWAYAGETPDTIHDWSLYVDGVKVEGYNQDGGVGPAGEDGLRFGICFRYVDPAREVMLVPKFTHSGERMDWAIRLVPAE